MQFKRIVTLTLSLLILISPSLTLAYNFTDLKNSTNNTVNKLKLGIKQNSGKIIAGISTSAIAILSYFAIKKYFHASGSQLRLTQSRLTQSQLTQSGLGQLATPVLTTNLVSPATLAQSGLTKSGMTKSCEILKNSPQLTLPANISPSLFDKFKKLLTAKNTAIFTAGAAVTAIAIGLLYLIFRNPRTTPNKSNFKPEETQTEKDEELEKLENTQKEELTKIEINVKSKKEELKAEETLIENAQKEAKAKETEYGNALAEMAKKLKLAEELAEKKVAEAIELEKKSAERKEAFEKETKELELEKEKAKTEIASVQEEAKVKKEEAKTTRDKIDAETSRLETEAKRAHDKIAEETEKKISEQKKQLEAILEELRNNHKTDIDRQIAEKTRQDREQTNSLSRQETENIMSAKKFELRKLELEKELRDLEKTEIKKKEAAIKKATKETEEAISNAEKIKNNKLEIIRSEVKEEENLLNGVKIKVLYVINKLSVSNNLLKEFNNDNEKTLLSAKTGKKAIIKKPIAKPVANQESKKEQPSPLGKFIKKTYNTEKRKENKAIAEEVLTDVESIENTEKN